ncbi:MAG: type II secretion system protein GspE, partial [Pirellula sp.]
LVASSLVATLAQRLVRVLCDACKNVHEDGTASPFGCELCRRSGFRGRVGLFELLVMNDPIRALVQSRENASVIRQSAIEMGLTLLAEDGRTKIRQGRTTLDEVLRVTSMQTVVG